MRRFLYVVMVVAFIAGLALHLFTCYIAYQVGFISTLLTFGLPVFAEIYWFYVLWSANGFMNIYSLAFLVVAGLYGIAYVGMEFVDDEKSAGSEP